MTLDWKTKQMINASGWPLAPELLSPGTDFHAPLANGLVPLHWACQGGKAGLVAHMLAHGTPPHARTDSGHTLLELALASRSFQTVMHVVDHLKATGSPRPPAALRAQLTEAFAASHTNAKNRLQQSLRDWDRLQKKSH